MRNQTFQKRQKEMARKDKQRAKAERKMQRKLEKTNAGPDAPSVDSDSGETDAPDLPAEDQTPT